MHNFIHQMLCKTQGCTELNMTNAIRLHSHRNDHMHKFVMFAYTNDLYQKLSQKLSPWSLILIFKHWTK